MRLAIAFALLSACEREGEGRFAPPNVGQRQDITTSGDLAIELPDGTTRNGRYRTVMQTQVLEATDLAIDKMRVVMFHDAYVFDGAVQRVRSGIYELSTTGGFTITKPGGEVTDEDRKYFADWRPTLDRRGMRNVLERTLRVGQRYVPTDEERDSLGFPRSRDLVVIPREVDREFVTFDITYDAELDDPRVVAHARGWIRYSAHHTEADQSADVTADGRHAGTMHWYDVRVSD